MLAGLTTTLRMMHHHDHHLFLQASNAVVLDFARGVRTHCPLRSLRRQRFVEKYRLLSIAAAHELQYVLIRLRSDTYGNGNGGESAHDAHG